MADRITEREDHLVVMNVLPHPAGGYAAGTDLFGWFNSISYMEG